MDFWRLSDRCGVVLSRTEVEIGYFSGLVALKSNQSFVEPEQRTETMNGVEQFDGLQLRDEMSWFGYEGVTLCHWKSLALKSRNVDLSQVSPTTREEASMKSHYHHHQ